MTEIVDWDVNKQTKIKENCLTQINKALVSLRRIAAYNIYMYAFNSCSYINAKIRLSCVAAHF